MGIICVGGKLDVLRFPPPASLKSWYQCMILYLCVMFVYYTSAAQFAPPNLLGYKLVGDNIDKRVKARFMRVEKHCGQSLHYFHFCAIQNRIDFGNYSDAQPQTCLDSPKKEHYISCHLMKTTMLLPTILLFWCPDYFSTI